MKMLIGLLMMAVVSLFTATAHAAPTTLTVQELSETPWTQALTAVDTANGNRVLNPNGDVFLILSNPTGSGGSATVTFTAQTTSVEFPGYGPVTKSNLAVSLSDGDTKLVGPFSKRSWNDGSGYLVFATTGAVSASVTVKALRLKQSLLR